MGAWGTHPQENDIAADFCLKLEEMSIRQWVLRGLKSDDYFENRIAAWMLRQVGYTYVWQAGLKHVCEMAIERLQVMLDDREWLNTWDKPVHMMQDIRHTIEELKERIALPVP